MQDIYDYHDSTKQDKLTAGTNITIDSNNVISASGGGGGTVDQTYDPTSTNAQSGTAVAEAVENKLTEPSSGLAVGKYFRVASIDADGHAVLECVDAPTAPVQSISAAGTELTPDANGNVEIPAAQKNVSGVVMVGKWSDYSGIATVGSTNYLVLLNASDAGITGRRVLNAIGFGAIDTRNFDFATKTAMTDGLGTAWTDAEKNGCYDRTTIRKTTLDNVLVPNGNYDLGSTEQASVTLTLPTPSGTDNYSCNEIYVAFKSGSTATTLSIVGTYAGDTSYVPSANSICELSFKYVCGTWVLVAKDTALPSA